MEAQYLEEAYRDARWDDWIENDPVAFVRRFDDPRDQEIAGIIAASLAYGRIGSIMPAVKRVLDAMNWRPYRFVTECDPECEARRFDACSHRFHTPAAIVSTLAAVHHAIRRHGTLGALFLRGYSDSDEDVRPALTHFVDAMRTLTPEGNGCADATYGWRHFLASPSDGSACKRMCLYVRWMVRTGNPDVGAWPDVNRAKLIVPVDVHVARISRSRKWTSRTAPDMKMALDVTAVLRQIDAADPIRFDFVISHLGMDGTS